ncbi:MAG: hypothetical protein ACKOHN_10255 [Actinomycetota bacterium]
MDEFADTDPGRRRGLFAQVRPDRRPSPGWAKVLAVFWTTHFLGFLAVAMSSEVIGRPLWWADRQRWSTPALVALIAIVVLPSFVLVAWSFARGPWTHWLAVAVGVELLGLAFVDRHDSPGAAVVLVVLGAAALLAALASLGSRPTA